MNIASLLQGLGVVAMLMVVGVVVLIVMRAARGQPLRNGGTVLGGTILVAVLLISIGAGLVFIQPEERGVVISAVSPRGTARKRSNPACAGSSRSPRPSSSTRSRSRPTPCPSRPAKAQSRGMIRSPPARWTGRRSSSTPRSSTRSTRPRSSTCTSTGRTATSNDLVRPQARGIIRDVVSQYRVEEVVSTKRVEMTQKIHDTMTKKLDENGLVLVDFVLRNITFSPGIRRLGRAETDRRAAGPAGQVRGRIEEAGGRTGPPDRPGRGDAVVIGAKGDAEARIDPGRGRSSKPCC